MHGGRSTGPRTEDGLNRLRSARTIHGRFTAEARAFRRHILTLTRRTRIFESAAWFYDDLPAALAQRLLCDPPELAPPPSPPPA